MPTGPARHSEAWDPESCPALLPSSQVPSQVSAAFPHTGVPLARLCIIALSTAPGGDSASLPVHAVHSLRKCVLTQSQDLSLRAEQKRHSMANELPRETCTCNTPYFPTCVPPRASPACPQQEADSHTGTHTRGLHSSSLTPNLVHTPLTLAIQVTVVTYVNKSQVVQRARRTPGREAVTGSR